MKTPFANGFRVILLVWFALSSPSLAHAQHGGGGLSGGHAGGGHFGGGRGHAHAGSSRHGGSGKPRGITRVPPFSAVRFFGHHHHRRLFRPFVANGLFVGGFSDCGFWDWNCGWDWDDGYFDDDNWIRPTPGSAPLSAGDTANSSRPVALLYFKNGYSVGVTQYWVENGELHYFTTYGGENVIPLGEIDLQRTIDENAGNDPPFVLRPKQPSPQSENH